MIEDSIVNAKGAGVDITMRSPSGQYEEVWSIRLDYPLSNNQAEYKGLIIGMQWALDTNIKVLEVFSDSQVVVGQVNHEYDVNSDGLKEYTEKVNRLAIQFLHFMLGKVDQSHNEAADRLAKIALGNAPMIWTWL